ncbi:hypothetical protein COOONC_06118 [Cooperia oncophora]
MTQTRHSVNPRCHSPHWPRGAKIASSLTWHSFCDQHVVTSDGFYDFVEDEGDRRAANVRERKRMCSINVAFITFPFEKTAAQEVDSP